MYVSCLVHVAVWQKLAHREAIILQLKIKNKQATASFSTQAPGFKFCLFKRVSYPGFRPLAFPNLSLCQWFLIPRNKKLGILVSRSKDPGLFSQRPIG